MSDRRPVHDHVLGEGKQRYRPESFDLEQHHVLRRPQPGGREHLVEKLRNPAARPAQGIAVTQNGHTILLARNIRIDTRRWLRPSDRCLPPKLSAICWKP